MYRCSTFVSSFICGVRLWMSAERGDSTYKPKQQLKRQPFPVGRRPVRSTRSDKDYSETVVVSDMEEDFEGEVGGREDHLD